MNIGTCVSLTAIEEMAEKFSMLRENGFDTCQMLAWGPEVWTAQNALALKELLKEYEITASAF